jgi:catalase
MVSKRSARVGATAVLCLLAGTALSQTTPTVDAPGQGAQAQPGSSGDADVEAIVNAQFAVAGNHKGVRASGAKGVCVRGAFTPSPEAPSLSKAPHFSKPSR